MGMGGRNVTKNRHWLVNAVLWTLVVPIQIILAAIGSPGGWLLLLGVPMLALNWMAWHATRAPELPPPARTPAFPAGQGCPPGCCPICGMEDEERPCTHENVQYHRQVNVWACHDCGRTVMPPTDPHWLTTIEQ